MLKQTYENITIRNKRKHDPKDITEEGFRKRAKMISNIIDHASNHDQKVRTKLLAKVIDQDPDSGESLKGQSKVVQGTSKLNPEQTTNLITWTRTSDYAWRQTRTAFNNALGFSPIASQKKVELSTKTMISTAEMCLIRFPALMSVTILEHLPT